MGHEFYINAMILVFFLGYFLITIEHVTRINKATTALLMAVICWILQFGNQNWTHEENITFLGDHLGNISQVIFFLIGALAVVEIISAHNGFKVISDYVKIQSKKKMFWAVGFITFFLSSILDNLTTTIVMIVFLQKIIEKREDRLIFGGGVVIAANAGGAWTPIGDVTTTMLWIGNQISTFNIMKELFIPSMICFLVSFFILSFSLKGKMSYKEEKLENNDNPPYGSLIFCLGIGLLVFVPVFKAITGLPPFMGVLLALSLLWLITDMLHTPHTHRSHLRVPHILTKIDMSSALFFLGILLCITSLESAGILGRLAVYLDQTIGNTDVIAIMIGLSSAVVDNVPLVAATMGMYNLSAYPIDSSFWSLIAYCAGTGGSILIFGSAAGVVFMGLEKADFMWYLKRISLPALIGFFAGALYYIFMY
jgi:NhaD family Na+/H+ antiporter